MSRFVIFCSFVFVLLISCQPTKQSDPDAFYLSNVNIIDPQEGLKEGQTLIIKKGRITEIAPSSELPLTASDNVVDGTGKFVMPGLWDMHVHFAYLEPLAPKMPDLFLGYGVTSVRDTGGRVELVMEYKNKSLSQAEASPRVMIAGPLLDGVPNVYDGSDEYHPVLSVGLGSAEDLKKEVYMLDSMHVDFLKAYEMLSPELFGKLMELGKQLGLKVTGHVPLSMDVISASNAGLNSMEHLRNMELSCASNADELLAQRVKMLADGKDKSGGTLRSEIHNAQREMAVKNFDEKKAREVLRILKANDTWQIPTLSLNTVDTE